MNKTKCPSRARVRCNLHVTSTFSVFERVCTINTSGQYEVGRGGHRAIVERLPSTAAANDIARTFSYD